MIQMMTEGHNNLKGCKVRFRVHLVTAMDDQGSE